MPTVNERTAVREFVKRWTAPNVGDEKSETQLFWIDLLQSLFGLRYSVRLLEFEKRVELDHVSFIDGYLPDTRVVIEQKGANINLDKAARQSDGTMCTPFEQAKRYYFALPHRDRGRWIVVSNFREIRIHDMNAPKVPPQIVMVKDLEKESYRLKFLINDQAEVAKKEVELSVAAGVLVGDLYDSLLEQYGENKTDPIYLKSLNELCVRLVFCLYAEDAGLFGAPMKFHDYLKGIPENMVRKALIDLFVVLDTKIEDRDEYLEEELASFPYVNGGLFSNRNIKIPPFNKKIITLLLENASEGFNWSEISPTIFGAVFESTLNPDTRRKGGMHYTSVSNIKKIIEPLFMSDLQEEFEEIIKLPQRTNNDIRIREDKLKKFQNKLASLKIFDPACGSGNFLTESYRELRLLENETLRQLNRGQAIIGFEEEGFNPVKVQISQFYGIEINDFACTVAKTALWIAESQMLKETQDIFQKDINFLPLKSYTNIVEGNALRMDWNDVISNKEVNYVIGNPPFAGRRYKSPEQQKDVCKLFTFQDMDYVACWFRIAADYIKNTPVRCAFVSTNSISQGEQVAPLWEPLYDLGVKIDFAYQTFVWKNEINSPDSAHVHVVIIGFSNNNAENKQKIIFNVDDDDKITSTKADNINGYLLNAPSVLIKSRSRPICDIPGMRNGNVPLDGDALKVEPEDLKDFKNCPWIKRLMGGQEMLHNLDRYVLWLVDVEPSELRKWPKVVERVRQCRENRLKMTDKDSRKLADTPTTFRDTNNPEFYIAVPMVSSQNRNYVPMTYLDKNTIPTNQIQTIQDTTLYHFGVLSSYIQTAWLRVVAGRLKSDYRFSSGVVYNNFPWPNATEEQKDKISKSAQGILDARANHKTSSLADLYDIDLMPPDLKKAHAQNDKEVMEAFGFSESMSENQIVEELFKLHEIRLKEFETAEAKRKAEEKEAKKKAAAEARALKKAQKLKKPTSEPISTSLPEEPSTTATDEPTKRTVAPKYRGPNGETWTGRGRMPRWLTALTQAGHEASEYLIK